MNLSVPSSRRWICRASASSLAMRPQRDGHGFAPGPVAFGGVGPVGVVASLVLLVPGAAAVGVGAFEIAAVPALGMVADQDRLPQRIGAGEHPAIPGARKPFSWQCGNFRYSAPGPLRAFLRQQAEINLARHGITEPVTWEPP
jgi:hypothetical protein